MKYIYLSRKYIWNFGRNHLSYGKNIRNIGLKDKMISKKQFYAMH